MRSRKDAVFREFARLQDLDPNFLPINFDGNELQSRMVQKHILTHIQGIRPLVQRSTNDLETNCAAPFSRGTGCSKLEESTRYFTRELRHSLRVTPFVVIPGVDLDPPNKTCGETNREVGTCRQEAGERRVRYQAQEATVSTDHAIW